MRKILMSRPGEFGAEPEPRSSFTRGLAMKKLADTIQPEQGPQKLNQQVCVSDDTKCYWPASPLIHTDKTD